MNLISEFKTEIIKAIVFILLFALSVVITNFTGKTKPVKYIISNAGF